MCQHFKDYKNKEATILTELGMYTPVIIDTHAFDIKSVCIGCDGEEYIGNYTENWVRDDYYFGDDVKEWLHFLNLSPILPCPKCNKANVFKVHIIRSEFSDYVYSFLDENKPFYSYNEYEDPDEEFEDSLKGSILQHSPFILEYTCSADHYQKICVEFIIKDANDSKHPGYVHLIKVGQYPAMGENCEFPNLAKENYDDYIMAQKSFFMGAGCGALTYLRRILERLVEDAHQYCSKNDTSWNENDYKTKKFAEKINLLESKQYIVLPKEFSGVKSPIYKLLSGGIHGYTDKDCLGLFKTMKSIIDMTLKEKIDREQRDLLAKTVNKKFSTKNQSKQP